jgi:hypothetical protein
MKQIVYFLILILFSCKTQDCPKRHTDLSERDYDKYCNRLKEAISKKDYFNEGSALCNLKQPPEKVYKLLNKSIKQHDSLCYQIHQYQDNNKNYGFQVSIIKIDTARWKKLCAECEKIVSSEKYYEKKSKEELTYKKERAIRENKLDTSLLDKKLIDHLAEIIEKDQRIISLKNPKEKEARNKERLHLDSLNLIEIDAIFKKEGGYPSLQKVGYDQIMTPWYVLQHQSSSIIRRKYMHYIEEAVQKGYINKNILVNYKDRTLGIEEHEKKKR